MEQQCDAIFEDVVGEATAAELDFPVRKYLINILEAQTSLDTSSSDSNVIKTISLFLENCGCCPSMKAAEEAVTRMLGKMKAMGMIPEKEPEVTTRLLAPIQMGRQYEKNMKEMAALGTVASYVPASIDVNTNADLNWDERRDQAKLDRRRKKEEEKRTQLIEEYDQYLARRGISTSQTAVKIHHGTGEWKGGVDIRCRNIKIAMGKTLLLDGTDLDIFAGRRYGLIGRNGVGKTTLLRFLAEGELEGVSPYLQILHIEQEYHGDDRTALQAVLDTDVERTRLLAEEEELLNSADGDIAARLDEVYERMNTIDAHGAEAKACAILAGLSFTTEMIHTATKKFSGGWRMRISLARALYISPDVLLLDEPTNHLDLHAVLWLENTLLGWEKTLVVVSHSRSFLNSIATDIIHYHNLKLTYYKGDYNQFEYTRYENLKNQQKTHEAQEKQRKHMQAFVDRWRCNAKRAKMAQSRMKQIEKMEFMAAVADDPSFQFSIPDPEPCAPPYLQIHDVTFGFSADRVLFRGVNIGLDNDSRIALVGPNGSGKSTFLNVIAGDLDPLDGRVTRNGKCRIARFTQHHVGQLNLQQTPLEFMKSCFPSSEDPDLRSQLGRFGLSGEKALQPIYTLSGGQKSRVAFAQMTYCKPHLLLLDEPTNHLDIDTVDALIAALSCYSGGVLIISHDEHLISQVCDEIWVAGHGHLTKFDGLFPEYKKVVLREMTKK